MERLIIRVDASTQIGTGHLMRCLALAQGWQDAGGRVTFITACQSEGLLQQLREEGLDIQILAHPHPHPGDWDGTSKVLEASPDAWVVLDGYHLDEVYQRQVKATGHRLLVIDDMAHLKHYHADILLNQNLGAEQLNYSCEPHTRLLLGTRYALLRREFLAWKDWRRDIPDMARRVLVILGGGDLANHTLKVVQTLQKIDVPGLEATVVIGASNLHADELEVAARQGHIPIRFVHSVRNMAELMAWADLAVSSSGSTVWELMFMGVPSLVFVVADNQRLVAGALGKSGLAVNLDSYKSSSSARIARAVIQLSQAREVRARMAGRSRELVDGEGVGRVMKFAQSCASKENRHNHE